MRPRYPRVALDDAICVVAATSHKHTDRSRRRLRAGALGLNATPRSCCVASRRWSARFRTSQAHHVVRAGACEHRPSGLKPPLDLSVALDDADLRPARHPTAAPIGRRRRFEQSPVRAETRGRARCLWALADARLRKSRTSTAAPTVGAGACEQAPFGTETRPPAPFCVALRTLVCVVAATSHQRTRSSRRLFGKRPSGLNLPLPSLGPSRTLSVWSPRRPKSHRSSAPALASMPRRD